MLLRDLLAFEYSFVDIIFGLAQKRKKAELFYREATPKNTIVI